jgi:hypothetical protein
MVCIKVPSCRWRLSGKAVPDIIRVVCQIVVGNFIMMLGYHLNEGQKGSSDITQHRQRTHTRSRLLHGYTYQKKLSAIISRTKSYTHEISWSVSRCPAAGGD